MAKTVVIALYKFVSLPDFAELQQPLLDHCKRIGLKGTLLLAHEGINGTVAGSRKAVDGLLEWLGKDQRFVPLDYKEALHDEPPFYRMRVKLKKEIVTIGLPEVSPTKKVGQYVKPQDWNELIDQPDVLLIDTRNNYEVAIGTFENAVDPKTTSFREFPEYVKEHLDPGKHPKVAMFCTGGIRCEKASAYMLEQGFEEVYHLQGGILKYLEEVPEQSSKWNGECFVFDNRVAVNHQLEQGSYDMCHGCRMPITEADKHSKNYQRGVCCPHCYESLSDDQKQRFAQRQKQMDLARERGEQHLGKANDND